MEKKKENAPISVPVEIFPPFPRAADREVGYFTVFYLFFWSPVLLQFLRMSA